VRNVDSRQIYHLTAHAVDGLNVFDDDLDCQDYVIRLGRVVNEADWRVFAVCLMGTHHHLLLRPTAGSVSDEMRLLQGAFARAFNKRHDRRGAVWESRFKSKLIDDHSHLLEAIRYVALNPVRAGLVDKPEDWPWGTYGQLCGTQTRWPFFDPLRVIALFKGLGPLRSYVETPRGV